LTTNCAFHLEREIEQNIRNGMSPEDARFAALKTFGAVDQSKEECRDARGVAPLENTRPRRFLQLARTAQELRFHDRRRADARTRHRRQHRDLQFCQRHSAAPASLLRNPIVLA
jgi:hypothetical protein